MGKYWALPLQYSLDLPNIGIKRLNVHVGLFIRQDKA